VSPVRHDPRVLAASTGSSGFYDALVGLHVLCAVVGFGAVAISGVYGASARRFPGPDPSEETRRYFQSPGRAEWLVLVVPFLGAAALGARHRGADFGSLWVILASTVWLVAAILLLGFVRPAERQIRAAVSAGGDGADGADGDGTSPAAAGRRLMRAAAGCDVLFMVALILMVYQPT